MFEAWAYSTCMETVSAILSQLSRANLEDMTSSLLLIRASLWEYGLQKVYMIVCVCVFVCACVRVCLCVCVCEVVALLYVVLETVTD